MMEPFIGLGINHPVGGLGISDNSDEIQRQPKYSAGKLLRGNGILERVIPARLKMETQMAMMQAGLRVATVIDTTD